MENPQPVVAEEKPLEDFDSRFNLGDDGQFDVKREKAKTLVILKLAKINHEGHEEHLSD